MRRRWLPLAPYLPLALCLPLVAPPAGADERQECADAHVAAQRARKKGKLIVAREQLILCARESCSEVVRTDCVAWLDEVEASIPTLVVVARGAGGEEVRDVRVLVDGVLLREQLDGKAMAVDPGVHRFRFEMEKTDPVEREIIVREGERNRTVEVVLGEKRRAAAGAAPAAEPAPGFAESGAASAPSPLAWVLGGMGVASLGGAGLFWLSSASAVSDLEASGCEPSCAQGQVDSIERQRLAGDVLLGVGVVSLGVAAVLVLSGPGEAPGRGSARVDAGALSGGGWVGAGIRF